MEGFKSLAANRYSVRKFDSKRVEQEKVDSLLEVARLAPTAHNNQPQRLLVLDSADSLNRLKDCTPCHFNAPLAIIVCYDNKASWKRSFDNGGYGGRRCKYCGDSYYTRGGGFRFGQHLGGLF